MASKVGEVTLDVYACIDQDCIDAGHPGHLGSVMRFPDGTEVAYPYGGVDRQASAGLRGAEAGRQLAGVLDRAHERIGVTPDEVDAFEAEVRQLQRDYGTGR